MRRRALTIGLLVPLLAGCVGDGEYEPRAKPTQLAAHAANSDYPRRSDISRDLSLTSTINQQTGVITLRNFSSRSLQDVRVWINENYVIPVSTIAPNSTTKINPTDVYDSAGNTLKGQRPQTIRKIEIEEDETVHAVEGPLFE